MSQDDSEDPIAIPITDEIDLHTFRPEEISDLLDSYFRECAKRGLRCVRVVHGKGTGTLRATVAHIVSRSPLVEGFRSGDETSGGWGATLVTLKPINSC